jgi:hypothetical protein
MATPPGDFLEAPSTPPPLPDIMPPEIPACAPSPPSEHRAPSFNIAPPVDALLPLETPDSVAPIDDAPSNILSCPKQDASSDDAGKKPPPHPIDEPAPHIPPAEQPTRPVDELKAQFKIPIAPEKDHKIMAQTTPENLPPSPAPTIRADGINVRFTIRFVIKDLWANLDVPVTALNRTSHDRYRVRDLLRAALRSCSVQPPEINPAVQTMSDSTAFLESTMTRQRAPSSSARAGVLLTPASNDVESMLMRDYGLYLPSRGHWLENDLSLSDYDIAPRLDGDDGSAESRGEVIELQNRQHFVRTISFAHYAEGWLCKKGDRSVVWKERFFVLRDKVRRPMSV